MKKLLLYGGSATAALLVAYYLGRRSGKRRPALSGTGVSAVDYTIEMPRLNALAAKQVAKATAGSWLTDYRKAEDFSIFTATPAYNVQAYYTAGYWMAVAARLIKSRALAAQASAMISKGTLQYILPGSSLLTGSVSSIMTTAASTIRTAAKTNKQVAAVLAAMKQVGDPEKVEAARERAGDRGWITRATAKTVEDASTLPGKAVDTASDIVSVLEWPASMVRMMLGLRNPLTGLDPAWWQKWGLRIGVGIASALLLRWYLKPRAEALKTILIQAPPAPKMIEAKEAA